MSEYVGLRVFDFDNTIYDGNATMDFFRYSLKKHKIRCIFLPIVLIYYILFRLNKVRIERAIEVAFKYLVNKRKFNRDIDDFWDLNMNKIKDFYKKIHSNDDLILSASLNIILRPFVDRFGVNLIASRFDIENGTFIGNICIGIEKRNRLYIAGIYEVGEFYTDNYTDVSIMQMADVAYLVLGNDINIVWRK